MSVKLTIKIFRIVDIEIILIFMKMAFGSIKIKYFVHVCCHLVRNIRKVAFCVQINAFWMFLLVEYSSVVDVKHILTFNSFNSAIPFLLYHFCIIFRTLRNVCLPNSNLINTLETNFNFSFTKHHSNNFMTQHDDNFTTNT